MKRNHLLAAAGALCIGLSPLTAHAYSALYVFGDSLSDAGNVYLATTAPNSPVPPEPAAPYFNGQFSNGPVWIETLSQNLGLGPVLPSLAPGGTDYAFGGATTGFAPTLSSPTLVPTLAEQVGGFLAAAGPAIPSSALYSVWIGSNDVLNIVASGTTGAAATGAAQGAALVEAQTIAALAAHGAKDFLVPLVSDLGKAPALGPSGSPASTLGTALTLAYDAALEGDLASLLAGVPGIDLSFLDTFSLVDNAVADPAAFGLTDVTDPCYTGPYTGGSGTVCATPETYLFWDQLHPTETGQLLIAADAFALVPEPATLTVLAAGLAGIATLRRRGKSSAV